MIYIIYYIDNLNKEHRFATEDIEYAKVTFEYFLKDDNINYVSFECLEVKK